MFRLGLGGLRGVLAGTLICVALPLLLVFTLLDVPWLNPTFVLLPVVLIPVALMWHRQTLRDRTEESGRDLHPT